MSLGSFLWLFRWLGVFLVMAMFSLVGKLEMNPFTRIPVEMTR